MAITATVRQVDARRESNSAITTQRRSSQQALHLTTFPCGACRYCSDACGDPDCDACADAAPPKMQRTMSGSSHGSMCSQGSNSKCAEFTMCEIRRHNTMDSCWLVAGNAIYDATTYISKHPGGSQSILKKSGGACDCTVDLNFHSKSGQKVWKKYIVGKVKRCACEGPTEEKQWWMFW